MSSVTHVPCPICGKLRIFSERYPNALCNSCGYSKDLVDSNGCPVKFANQSPFGGFISLHNENGVIVERQEHTCFLNGIECDATEARFGGIAVQVLVSCPACHVLGVSRTEKRLGGLCYECVSKMTDTNGNHVRFDYKNGFISIHYENELWIKKKDHDCFLDGAKYYAYNHNDRIIVSLCNINDSC